MGALESIWSAKKKKNDMMKSTMTTWLHYRNHSILRKARTVVNLVS